MVTVQAVADPWKMIEVPQDPDMVPLPLNVNSWEQLHHRSFYHLMQLCLLGILP